MKYETARLAYQSAANAKFGPQAGYDDVLKAVTTRVSDCDFLQDMTPCTFHGASHFLNLDSSPAYRCGGWAGEVHSAGAGQSWWARTVFPHSSYHLAG
jgi:hypothetical protein